MSNKEFKELRETIDRAKYTRYLIKFRDILKTKDLTILQVNYLLKMCNTLFIVEPRIKSAYIRALRENKNLSTETRAYVYLM